MSNWEKVIYSGSQAELEALRIDGVSEITDSSPGDPGPEQNFYLKAFDEDISGPVLPSNSPWLSAATHSNASGEPWVVNSGSFNDGYTPPFDDPSDASDYYGFHYPFEVHNGGSSGGSSGTGPDGGVAWTDPTGSIPMEKNIDETLPYLHADTSDVENSTSGLTAGGPSGIFSLVSPPIQLTSNHSNSKLVFYHHMYSAGDTMGTLKVFKCSSSSSLVTAEHLQLTFWDGASERGGYSIVGPQQASQSDPYYWVEVDVSGLSTTEPEYIWIIYQGGGDYQGDCALGHIHFTTTDTPDDVITTTSAPVALKVYSSDIKFHNLPTSDPNNPGQLWKDDSDGGALSYIRVSAE